MAAEAAGGATGGDGDWRALEAAEAAEAAEVRNGAVAAGAAGAARLHLPAWLQCVPPCLQPCLMSPPVHVAPGSKKMSAGGAAVEEAGAATREAGEAEAVTREAEEAEGAGAIDEPFAADTLAVLELEANGQTRLPPLHPHNTVLVALLASFNQLGAAPPQIARYGAPL